MLFQAEITAKTVRDEDKLVEQLYIFLWDYVPTRLIYESKENQEDCVQDTILFILKRLDELYKELKANNPLDLITFNYEKWIYNRARSYISYWLRKVVRDRKQEREYVEHAIYLMENTASTYNPDYIDYVLLESIALSYLLGENDTIYLLKTMETMLEGISYTSLHRYIDIPVIEQISHIPLIAYAAVDEYIYESGVSGIDT